MEAKEKALDLVCELRVKIEEELGNGENEVSIFFAAKQCALICIDEMILISDDSKEQKYLEEVKNEINNL